MQNLASPQMSDNSQPSSIPDAPQFVAHSLRSCDVDVADIGDDIVYHFWPRKGDLDFPPKFATYLEEAFMAVLPTDADVRADYTNRDEAAAFMRFNESADSESDPVPTYYVRVVGWADNPMSDTFLKKKVFDELDKAYGDTLNVHDKEI